MTDDAAFAATYSDWKPIKTRRVIQIVFEVPWEKHNEAYQALGGMPDPGAERWFGIARLNPQQPQEKQDQEIRKSKVPASATPEQHQSARAPNRYAQRAGILCNDPLFQTWFNEEAPIGCGAVVDAETAAIALREYCRVNSRADIKLGTEAAIRLDLLESAFVVWRDRDQYVETE